MTNKYYVPEQKPSTVAFPTLYYMFDPDIFKKICNLVHDKYYDFVFKNWDKLLVDDCVFFSKETKNTEVVRFFLKNAHVHQKFYILRELLPFAIENNILPLFELLVTCILGYTTKPSYSESYTYSCIIKRNIELAIAFDRKEMVRYIENYNKLTINKLNNNTLVKYRKNQRMKQKLFRNKF